MLLHFLASLSNPLHLFPSKHSIESQIHRHTHNCDMRTNNNICFMFWQIFSPRIHQNYTVLGKLFLPPLQHLGWVSSLVFYYFYYCYSEWGDTLAATSRNWGKGSGHLKRMRSFWDISPSMAMVAGVLFPSKLVIYLAKVPFNFSTFLNLLFLNPISYSQSQEKKRKEKKRKEKKEFSAWVNSKMKILFRFTEVWEELQIEVDQLPEAWLEERHILTRRRKSYHWTSCCSGE